MASEQIKRAQAEAKAMLEIVATVGTEWHEDDNPNEPAYGEDGYCEIWNPGIVASSPTGIFWTYDVTVESDDNGKAVWVLTEWLQDGRHARSLDLGRFNSHVAAMAHALRKAAELKATVC